MPRILAALAVATVLSSQVYPAQLRAVASGPGYARLLWEAPEAAELGGSGLVGLPLDGSAALQVVEARSRRLPPGTLTLRSTPAPPLHGPACLGQEGMLRGQHVVEVLFGPSRTEDGGLLVYDRVVVDVRFTGSAGSVPTRPDRWGEDLLRQVVANYDQARSWRQGSRPPAARPVSRRSDVQRLRLSIKEEGIYRITGADLQQAGVSLTSLDSQHMRLLYGGGMPLPQTIAGPQGLQEMACWVQDGGDGRFDVQDTLVFYGQAPSRWTWQPADTAYVWLQNVYTNYTVYWLELGSAPARQASPVSSGALQGAEAYRPQSYRVRVHEEPEEHVQAQTYGINSGYEWYWEDFRGNARAYRPLIHEPGPDSVTVRLRFLALDQGAVNDYKPWHPVLSARWNDQVIGQLDWVSTETRVFELRAAPPLDGLNQLSLVHENVETARLDWYELEYTRAFAADQSALVWDAPARDGVVEYHLTGFASEPPRLFRVSVPQAQITDLRYDAASGTVAFQQPGGRQPQRFMAVAPSRWKRPVSLQLDTSQDLLQPGRGAEYLVVTHGDFRAMADELAAWRAQDDRFGTPLSTRVVDIQDVYDAFSGGMVDPAALRDFIAYAYHYWETPPFYVLLLGDGTYDYKNNSGTSPGIWIPAFQDGDSTYDEWFVRVDGEDILPDLAIGRLPVQTPAEAQTVVDKIIGYDRAPEPGPWQGRILLVSDDLNNPEKVESYESYFIMDSENVARNLLPPNLDLQKLYLAQYPLVGSTKPAATAEFLRRFNEGVVIFTYIGHGNPDVLAHERVFVVSRDLGSIANGRRLPFAYTAASQVGVFDDPTKDSMPEALLKRADGGVVGMISATRVGYHESNMILANAFHRQMYRSGRDHVPVGQALMEAKRLVQVPDGATGRRNVQRYSLFGDPATRLAVPRYTVAVQAPDSLQALEEVRVEGQVLDPQGQPAGQASGQVLLQAFDSAAMSELNAIPYLQGGRPLFRGYVPLRNGRFAAAFRVPKDITYHGQLGRLSAYAWPNGTVPAAFGAADRLTLAGTDPEAPTDDEGPQIELGFEGRAQVADGVHIQPGATLRAVLSDPGGINVTGGTGHAIELGVDQQQYTVTDYFYAQDGYRQGTLTYPLPVLEPGGHDIRLKVWDTYNNAGQASLHVVVSQDADLLLSELLAYPNPLDGTDERFTFHLALDGGTARIRVYSLTGRVVAQVVQQVTRGFNQVAWRAPAGLANGAYPYHVEIESQDGRTLSRTGVLQVLR